MAPLRTYRRKRDFSKSPEPKGRSRSEQSTGKTHRRPLFVVQKHDASHLHYDFRLEIGGALKSWAVPKGPSTDPRQKRLAVETEDHPLDYARFEGVIPEGEYGAGTVMVWDIGRFRPVGKEDEDNDLEKAYERGLIEVELDGRKLRGGYALKKFSGRRKQWLLIKMRDDEADARRNPTSSEPKSALSDRTMHQIARDAED